MMERIAWTLLCAWLRNYDGGPAWLARRIHDLEAGMRRSFDHHHAQGDTATVAASRAVHDTVLATEAIVAARHVQTG